MNGLDVANCDLSTCIEARRLGMASPDGITELTSKCNEVELFFVAPSLGGGGAERVVLALSSFFLKEGYPFTIVLTKDKSVHYKIPQGVSLVDDFASPSVKPLQQITYIRRLMKARPAAVFMSFLPHQNMYTLLASVGLPNKVIISVRNDPRFDFPGSTFLPHVRNALYRKADAIVFQTEAQAHLLPSRLEANGTVIFNPLSESVPEPYDGGRRKVITTSGRLEEQKNHEMTIRAFARFRHSHPDYKLEVFGEGSLDTSLRELASNVGVADAVSFEGFSPDALDYIRTSAVFVMSSRFEGLSNSMLESLCMGVPTVCTRCMGGGAEAVIDDGVNGILVDIDDVEAEANAMAHLVDNSEYAKAIGLRARELRQQLSLETIGDKWLSLL